MIDIGLQWIYDWEWTDYPGKSVVSFRFPDNFNIACIQFALNEDKNSVLATIPAKVPFLCGHLHKDAAGIDSMIKDSTCTLTIMKEQEESWPILINNIHLDLMMIDPKSAFLFFRYLSAKRDETFGKLGYQFLECSARAGFITALQVLSAILLDVEGRESDGVKLLKAGADMYQDGQCAYQLGLYYSTNDIAKAFHYLQKAADKGFQAAFFTLGQIYSPLSSFEYQGKDADKAMELFSKISGDAKLPDLYSEMAKFYENGIAVEKDLEKAAELKDKSKLLAEELARESARNIIQDFDEETELIGQNNNFFPERQIVEEPKPLHKGILIGVTALVGAVFGYLAFKRMHRGT